MEGMHKSVLVDQAVYYLRCHPGGIYCDGTVGTGGHAERMLEVTSPNGRLIGIDLDFLVLARAKERLARFGDRVILVQGNFKDLPSILKSNQFPALDGVLLDLGFSSYQLESEQRGFSFLHKAPLIMNFDVNGREKASDIINRYSESRLADIIWRYGQDRWSRRIAHKIVAERSKTPIETTSHLAEIVCSAIPGSKKKWKIHPATRTFQALRIEVNHELESLDQFLRIVWKCLKLRARVCIISFHSLEDRLVKMHFRDMAMQNHKSLGEGKVELITKKPLRPGPEEIKGNPRSRSARMRVAEWH